MSCCVLTIQFPLFAGIECFRFLVLLNSRTIPSGLIANSISEDIKQNRELIFQKCTCDSRLVIEEILNEV